MDKELEYVEKTLSRVEERINFYKGLPNLKNSLGLQTVLKHREEEKKIIENIIYLLHSLKE